MINRIRALKALGLSYLLEHPRLARMLSYLVEAQKRQQGNIISSVILVVLGILVVGTVIPAMWPIAVGTLTDVANMNGTDTGTSLIKALWPVGVMVAAIGLGIWLIFFALKKLGVMSAGGKGGKGW